MRRTGSVKLSVGRPADLWASFTKVRVILSRHALPLGVVVLGCLISQATILTRSPLIVTNPDSPLYAALGQRLAEHPSLLNLFDPLRTPGYPAFLALLDILGIHGFMVVYGQAALLVIAGLEVYILAQGLAGSRVAGAIAGLLVGANLLLIDWERALLSESLAFLAVTTTALCFWLWLRHRGVGWALAFSTSSLLGIMTRPSLLFLPLCLAAFVVIGDRRRWLAGVAVIVGVYLTVAGYGAVNNYLYPQSGLSTSSSYNLLGKIEEYRMENEGDAARYPTLWQEANNVSAADPNPSKTLYNELLAQPEVRGANWENAGQFSRAIVLRHPLEYIIKSGGDLMVVWQVQPYTFAPVVFGSALDAQVGAIELSLSHFAYEAYPLMPLTILLLILAWRRIESQAALGIAALGVSVLGGILVTATLGFDDFARLRAPVDSLAMVVTIALAARLWQAVVGVNAGRAATKVAKPGLPGAPPLI